MMQWFDKVVESLAEVIDFSPEFIFFEQKIVKFKFEKKISIESEFEEMPE